MSARPLVVCLGVFFQNTAWSYLLACHLILPPFRVKMLLFQARLGPATMPSRKITVMHI